MAYKTNPFKTIVSQNNKRSRALEYLLKKAPEIDVIDSLREIRAQIKKEEKSKKPPYALARIQKLLLDYPGFQKEMLDTLNLLIREAKKNGTIDQYAAKKKIVAKPKPKKAIVPQSGETPPQKPEAAPEDTPPQLLSEEEFTSRTMEIDMDSLKPFLNKAEKK